MPPLANLVGNGQFALAIAIALVAGLVSFVSPCVLPLVPGYLGYVGGASGAGEGAPDRARLIKGVSLFVLGFTVIFVLLNGAFGVLGFWLVHWEATIIRFAGVLVILLGLVFIGQFGVLQRSIRPSWLPATGLAGAPVLGIVFGLSWTPCLSPTLAMITAISMHEGSAVQGVILGFAYSLGLGLPFVLVSLGLGWVTGSVAFIKRHIRVINLCGGSLLVLIGVLMVAGVWSIIMSQLGAVIAPFVPAL
ncbi:MAG: cytochrome c biogenesis CcdA family protein [Microbacteriaceae bacterium]